LTFLSLPPRKLATFDTWSSLAVHIAMDNTVVMEEIRRLCKLSCPCPGASAFPLAESDLLSNGYPDGAECTDRLLLWKPLVLLIPLRLGLTDINEAYIETLKHCFMMPQSLGVIGGKPNSAHYFIGYVGEELIYLDPHTTQPAVEPIDSCHIPDESFHCQHPPCRMSISELDPSIAVGFFCNKEEDFNDWCQRIKKNFRETPIFSVTLVKNLWWPEELLVDVNSDLFVVAQMGVGEGKSIGQWYGPNTVAQVLR
ncbi:hypothetical protein JD844_007192, partial [Phrynosoma platyrhinos]